MFIVRTVIMERKNVEKTMKASNFTYDEPKKKIVDWSCFLQNPLPSLRLLQLSFAKSAKDMEIEGTLQIVQLQLKKLLDRLGIPTTDVPVEHSILQDSMFCKVSTQMGHCMGDF